VIIGPDGTIAYRDRVLTPYERLKQELAKLL
jgi:hypothetical protein